MIKRLFGAVALVSILTFALAQGGLRTEITRSIGADTITTKNFSANWQLIGTQIATAVIDNDSGYILSVNINGVAKLNRYEVLYLGVNRGIKAATADSLLGTGVVASWDIGPNIYLRGALAQEVPFSFTFSVQDSSNVPDTIWVVGAVGGGSQIELEDVYIYVTVKPRKPQ